MENVPNLTMEIKQTKKADKSEVNYWYAPFNLTENAFAERPAYCWDSLLKGSCDCKRTGMFPHERRHCRTSFPLTKAEGSTGCFCF